MLKRGKVTEPGATRGAIVKAVQSTGPGKVGRPVGGGGTVTFEKLVRAAGEVLSEVGFEKLTSNAICARAGVTPPSFYHHFRDKYQVLEELAQRLLSKQNEAFRTWVGGYEESPNPVPSLEELERWFSTATDIVAREPGGIWTMRALRALPHLNHVRLEWQRQYTDQIFQLTRRFVQETDWPLLWTRIRILAEFGYVVDELVYEEDRVAKEIIICEAARLVHASLRSVFDAQQ